MKLLEKLGNIFSHKDPITYKDGKVFYNGRIVTDGKEGLKEHRVFYSEGKYYHKGNGKEATLKDLISVDEFNLLAQQTALKGIETFVTGNKFNATTNEAKNINKQINAINDLLEITENSNIEEYTELRRRIYLDLSKFEKEKVDLNPRIVYDLDNKYKVVYLNEDETKEDYLKQQESQKYNSIKTVYVKPKEKKPLEIIR